MIGAGVAGLQGDRHGTTARRGHLGLRPAARREGTVPEPRRAVRRTPPRSPGRGGRTGLCPHRMKRFIAASANCWVGSWPERCRHHGRRGPGKEIAGPRDAGEMVAGMSPGLRDRGPRRQPRGELRADEAGSEVVVEHGVTVIGWVNLASTVPFHASQMYARNLEPRVPPPPRPERRSTPAGPGRRDPPRHDGDEGRRHRERPGARFRTQAPGRNHPMKLDLITSLYVFMLAGFIGFEVIRHRSLRCSTRR